jgi:hypothetical protein
MAPVIAKAASRHGLTDRLTGRWASCGAPRDSRSLVRRGRVAGRIGLMGIIGNRDPDLPGDQHTQFGAEQGAPDAGQVQRTHIKAASNHPPGPLLERSCSSARSSAKAASAACSKAMRAADTPGFAAGGPDTAGGRWSGAGSRLHPRVREATTQPAGFLGRLVRTAWSAARTWPAGCSATSVAATVVADGLDLMGVMVASSRRTATQNASTRSTACSSPPHGPRSGR